MAQVVLMPRRWILFGGDAECTTSLSRTTEIFHSHLLALAPNSNIHETEKKSEDI